MWQGPYLVNGIDTVMNTGGPYTYDDFGRLSSFSSNVGQASSFTWAYDRWGNRWSQTPGASVTFNAATNHKSDSSTVYDAAGNIIQDAAHTYAYDAENMLISVDNGQTASYTYDALGQRVRVSVPGASRPNLEYTYDFAGRKIGTWLAGTSTGIQGQVWWGNTPFAYRGLNGWTYFQHSDWVGTMRKLTDPSGNAAATYKSNPFGDGYSASGPDENREHYAGTEHDAESGTDHAQFRQYSTNVGFWMSMDPYMGSYDFDNPQSFNRYIYALNNPLSLIDPSGLQCIYNSTDGNTVDDGNPPPCGSLTGGDAYYPVDGSLPWYIQEYGFPPGYQFPYSNSSSVSATPNYGPAHLDPNKQRSGYESIFCLGDALKSNALSVALDAIGLIPEAEGFTKVFENTAGYQLARSVGNNAGYRGVVATQYGIKAVAQGKASVALINGALGLGDTSVEERISTGATIAGFIPGLSTGAAAVSLGVDAYKISTAQSACVDSGKYD